MKIFQIFNKFVHYDMTKLYSSVDDAKFHYAPDIEIIEAPDYVFVGWGYDSNAEGDARFIKPAPPEGFEYDETTGLFREKWAEIKRKIDMCATKVENAKNELASTDYKIIKCSEYQLAGLDSPYDITTLHTERQALRDEINKLETQLAAAEAELAKKEAEEKNA